MAIKRIVDTASWARREHFEYYRSSVPCTYSVTIELDVTALARALRATGRKTYVAQIWAIASIVNRHEEFRMTVDEHGTPAVWDVVHPSFTVFNPDRETFASVWTTYDPDFSRFHDRTVKLLATHRNAISMFPQGDEPENVFDVSSVPWMHFTGFDLHIAKGFDHYLPIFTLGQYQENDGRALLPVAVQMHHAAADGFHVSRLLNELQDVFGRATEWVH